MHVLPRPHLPRQLSVVMAAILAIVLTLVLLAALRSVGSNSGGSASRGTVTPAARVTPGQAPYAATSFMSPTHALNVPTPLRWGTSPIPASLRRSM